MVGPARGACAMLVGVVVACGETVPEQAAAPPPSTGAMPGDVAPEPPDSATLLVDPGREPRRPLRYTFVPGARYRVELSTALTEEQTLNGEPGATVRWESTGIVEIAVASVAHDTAALEATLVSIDATWERLLSGPAADDARRAVERLIGKVFHHRIDRRGFLVEDGARLPPDSADPRFVVMAAVNAMLVRRVLLPAEPVGPGARWRVETDEREGLVTREIQLVELVGLDGDRAELAITTTVEAEPQVAQTQAESVIGYDTVDVHGKGRVTLDLRAPLPLLLAADTDHHYAGRSIGPEELPTLIRKTSQVRVRAERAR